MPQAKGRNLGKCSCIVLTSRLLREDNTDDAEKIFLFGLFQELVKHRSNSLTRQVA